MSSREPPAFVAVGRISRAHGIKGEVAVLPLTQVPDRFEPGSRLFLDEDPAGRSLTVAASRPHQKRVLVKFEGVADRNQAESPAGPLPVRPRAAEVPDPPEGEFWSHQLVGCRVATESGRDLGEVREVVPGAGERLVGGGAGDGRDDGAGAEGRGDRGGRRGEADPGARRAGHHRPRRGSGSGRRRPWRGRAPI